MSDSNRGERNALVALGLALVAVVSVAWITNKPTSEQVRKPNSKYVTQGEDNPIELTSLWEFYTNPEDTYAQWLMAFFSIIATGFSIRAVYLVRDTLREAQRASEAAIEANRIAKENSAFEQRPWIDFEVTFRKIIREKNENGVEGWLVEYTVKIENLGKSPAFKGAMLAEICAASSADAELKKIDLVTRLENWTHANQVILNGKVGTYTSYIYTDSIQNWQNIGIVVGYRYTWQGSSCVHFTTKFYIVRLVKPDILENTNIAPKCDYT